MNTENSFDFEVLSITPLSKADKKVRVYLDSLSDYVEEIYVGGRQVNSLPSLKRFTRLRYLTCADNRLTALPALPDSLQNLICSDNRLTKLHVLSNSLQELDCSHNNLTALPTLPNSLQKLYCYFNKLTELPTLPNSLQRLDCRANNLTAIPNCPDGLQIWCDVLITPSVKEQMTRYAI